MILYCQTCWRVFEQPDWRLDEHSGYRDCFDCLTGHVTPEQRHTGFVASMRLVDDKTLMRWANNPLISGQRREVAQQVLDERKQLAGLKHAVEDARTANEALSAQVEQLRDALKRENKEICEATVEAVREGRIEAAVRQSERARIVAWLRSFAPLAEGRDISGLVDAIERGEHWRQR